MDLSGCVMKLALLAVLMPSLLWAGVQFTPSLEQTKTEWRIVLTAPSGHHFNQQAPAAIGSDPKGIFRLVEKKPTQISFAAPISSVRSTEVIASAYLCDDANTFCQKDEQSVSLSTKAKGGKLQKIPTH